MGHESTSIESLREQLLLVSSEAREFDIDEKTREFDARRSQVEVIIEELRRRYSIDSEPFDEDFLDDIHLAKINARILSRADLDREEVQRQRTAIITAHAAFLKRLGMKNIGTRFGIGHHRIAHCYNCKRHLDNEVDVECCACRWIICTCGACGCDSAKGA